MEIVVIIIAANVLFFVIFKWWNNSNLNKKQEDIIHTEKENRILDNENKNSVLYKKYTLTEEQNYYIGEKCIGLTPRKGYIKIPIKGMYYRNISINEIGHFNGYSITETSNQYDPYAIAIYKDNGLHIGYVPKGNKKLYEYIRDEGGKVHTYGYIAYSDYDNDFYAECCIEYDKNLVIKRNKPFE